MRRLSTLLFVQLSVRGRVVCFASRCLGVMLLAFIFIPLSHADGARSAPVSLQDFIVMEAESKAQGFVFHDLLLLDPEDGRILKVLPMSPLLIDANPELHPDDLLLLFPTDGTMTGTVVAPSGQTLAHSRILDQDGATRQVHSYVWNLVSDELIFTLKEAYSFGLLGDEGDHLAILTKNHSTAMTEFQVWNIYENQLVFKAGFLASESVRAHKTRSTHFAVFSVDKDYVMLWDHRQGRLRLIAVPERNQLVQARHDHQWNMLQGVIEISVDNRWLAFITESMLPEPARNYYLIDLDEPGTLEPFELPVSGTNQGASPYNWISFGAGLLGVSETSLFNLTLPSGQIAGEWFPKVWVRLQHCVGPSIISRRRCSPEQKQERARQAFLPPDALVETLQVDLHARYVANSDATMLATWDSYNNRPIILDTRDFPPHEVSPGRPDGSNPAKLYVFKPGMPRDSGRYKAPGLLGFSHFGRHLVTYTPVEGLNHSFPVLIDSYSIPDLRHRPHINPSLSDYLHARNESPSLHELALCRVKPAVCLNDKMHPQYDAILAEQAATAAETMLSDHVPPDESPDLVEPWMRRVPERTREPAPELCKAIERIRHPIQGAPFFIDDRYEGIRIVGQSEVVAGNPEIPFRDGDILFDGGWCANRACTAEHFSHEIKKICSSRGRNLVRAFVLEVGSADPGRNRAWVLMEKP